MRFRERDEWSVRRAPRRPWLVVLLAGALVGVVGVLALGTGERAGTTPRPAAAVAPAPIEVLHDWDRRRAAAWTAGDRTRLRTLYLPGSAAAQVDLALLDRYLDRGLTVAGMRRQVVRAEVLDADDRRVRLRVTDRLVGAWAVSSEAPVRRVRLPESQPRTRVLDLRRDADTGEWRMR